MKEEYKDFVGIYDENVPVELCNEFVENYEVAKKNRTIIDLSKENETQILQHEPPLIRKDEAAFIHPILSTIYPIPSVKTYFEFLIKCVDRYTERYSIEFNGAIYNDVF